MMMIQNTPHDGKHSTAAFGIPLVVVDIIPNLVRNCQPPHSVLWCACQGKRKLVWMVGGTASTHPHPHRTELTIELGDQQQYTTLWVKKFQHPP
jgi:hypothetical protein